MGETEVKNYLLKCIARNVQNVKKLSAKKMISESAINPFLVRAIGINNFDDLAKFYVYQRVGRSIVTSFGSAIEHIVRDLVDGTEGTWWDVVATIDEKPHYISVKSGPRDMDKDQVTYFSNRAKEAMAKEATAVAFIAMGYGKSPWPIVPKTLVDNGLDPKKHLFIGKDLYGYISGEKDYHVKLLEIIRGAADQALNGSKIVDIIEDKITEISEDFKNHYASLDDLLLDTF